MTLTYKGRKRLNRRLRSKNVNCHGSPVNGLRAEVRFLLLMNNQGDDDNSEVSTAIG